MILMISVIFIIVGFVVFFKYREIKKETRELKVATVRAVDEVEDGYYLTVSYHLDSDEQLLDRELKTTQVKSVGSKVAIKVEEDDSVYLYNENPTVLFLTVFCWAIVLIFWIFAR